MAVEVWSARPGDERAWHQQLLDEPERERRAALRRPEDRGRFTVAAALLKLAAGQRLGVPAEQIGIDRTCADCGRPHGRPRLPGHPLAASISHSGDRVLVAFTGGPAVGVDVEQVKPVDVAAMAGQVLGDGEVLGDGAAAPALPDFFRYWTRKEAVVKATGDGLRMALRDVVVAPPGEPARLLRYGDRADLVASLADLPADDGYAAAVAVLAPGPLRIDQRDASALLTRA